jgi:thymidylate kinase
MTPRQHKFITIEGLKGSGKTSVSRALAEQLGARWYTTPPELFRPIRDAVEQEASPYARYLYCFAGIVQASAEIELLLARQSVVCDKFLATMLAYSRAGGVQAAAPPTSVVLQPDFSFLLSVPDEVRRQRIASRGYASAEQEAFLCMEIECHVIDFYRDLNVRVHDNSGLDISATVADIRSVIE